MRKRQERKPGRSARSSRSKSSSRDVSTLKGLVKGVGAAGSSNAGGRASFVGFSVLLERAGAFFAVLFCVFLLSVVGEGRSLAEERERLPLPLSGVGAERSIKVLMLAVCAVPVCTGVCASVRASGGARSALRLSWRRGRFRRISSRRAEPGERQPWIDQDATPPREVGVDAVASRHRIR